MRIRSIRIKDFRKLTAPICIDRIGDGITVISGDNEEGKSTVLAAIRTALFTRHRVCGDAAERMQPFGQSVRPEIHLEFEVGGRKHTLRKAFCRRPEAELTWAGGRATGDAAEDKLQQLLQFSPPGKGVGKSEHQGIWGFWVDQGTSFRALAMSDGSRQTLVSALEGEVGQVLGGERGRLLLQRIRSRCEATFTAHKKPRGEFRNAIETVGQLEDQAAKLRGELASYEHKLEELDGIRDRIAIYERERVLERARERLSRAEAAHQRILELKNRLKDAQNAAEIARSKRGEAAERWNSRAKKMEASRAAEAEADSAACREAEARRAVEPLERLLTETRAAEEQQRRAYGEADAMYGAAEQDLRCARAEAELAQLRDRRRKAAGALDAGQTARAGMLAISVDEAKLARLRSLEKTADEARVRLRAVATRLDFAPEGARRITCANGEAVMPGEPLLLTEATTLHFEQFGSVTITPGGEDLSGLHNAAYRAREELLSALTILGIADVAAAARAAEERRRLLTEAETQERLADVHAPDGLLALDREIALKEIEQAALSQGALRPAPTIEAAEANVREASKRRAAAARMLTDERSRVDDAEQRWRAARETWLQAQVGHRDAKARADGFAMELQEARRSAPDIDLSEAVADAATELTAAKAQCQAAAAALDQEDPEAVAQRLKEAEQAARQAREDVERLRRRADDIEIELRALGQRGLGEDLAITQGKLDHARERSRALEREAKAIQLLHETLREAEQAAKDAFLGPVRARVRPYLEVLFPGAELELQKDTLDITHLRRANVPEPFASLSIGTQEQLAILTRLAFADVLRERGQPAAVILDDALAYSDCNRFDRMQIVLRNASRNFQVLVLTCRESDYIDRGLPLVRLAQCRTPEPVC